ncbi:MAG: TetR/AcrR family transcriptional regulator [Bacteroidetes bacterium]|nr:TetR/AcrR family transcriptional regulator [Bacteroidota bacterium]MBS1650040.1 TetR/AcrR family transcriptional regulator [Bacteroidota bacterium]
MATDKKQHIIEKAIELFSEKGFEGTSIRDLANKAEVNIAMMNYYFGSKEGLFQQIVETRMATTRDKIEEIAINKTLSEIEKVDLIIELYVEGFLSQPGFHKMIQQEMLVTKREDMHEKLINTFIQNTNNFNSIIEKGIRKKAFKKVDAPLVFATIVGTANQVLKSKKICNVFIGHNKNYEPYKDTSFKERLITHIKQLIHAHLLNK